MKKILLLVKNVFYPSVQLVNRLANKQKFRLIALLGAIPIAILMIFLLREINSGISFTNKEELGFEYVQKLYQLSKTVYDHAEVEYIYYGGNKEIKDKVAAAKSKIDDAIKEVDTINDKLDRELKTSAKWEEVKNNWKNNQVNESASQSFSAHVDFMTDIMNMMRTVADNSNLTLDTKVDSHYLIDTMMARIPVQSSYLIQAKILGVGKLTSDTKAKLGLYAVLIQDSLDGISSSLGRVFNYNDSLRSTLGPIQGEINAIGPDSVKAINNRLLVETGINLDQSDYVPSIQASLDSTDKLYNAIVPSLEKILKDRVHGLKTRRWSIVMTVSLILAMVVYLFIAIYISVIEISAALAKRDKELAEINKNLEKVVEQRTLQLKEEIRNISNLLNGMQQAVFAVGVDGKVVPPVSRYSQTVFGRPIEGESLFETIYKDIDTKSERFASIKTAMTTVFGENDIQWSLMEDNFPKQLEYRLPNATDDDPRILKVVIYPLWDDQERLQKLMFIVEDITEVLKLERHVAAEKAASARNIEMIQELAALEMDELKSYFSASYRLINECFELVNKSGNPEEAMPVVMRNLHTLKGNARVFGFSAISSLVHSVESDVGAIREQLQAGKVDQDAAKQFVLSALFQVQSSIHEYGRLTKKIFRIEDEFEIKAIATVHRQTQDVDVLMSSALGCADSFIERQPESPEAIKAIQSLSEAETKSTIENLGRSVSALVHTISTFGEKQLIDESKELEAGVAQLEQGNGLTSAVVAKKVIEPWQKLRKSLRVDYCSSSLFSPYRVAANVWVPIFCGLLNTTLQFEKYRKDKSNAEQVRLTSVVHDLWSSCSSHGLEYMAALTSKLEEAVSGAADLAKAEMVLRQVWRYLSLVSQASLLDFPPVKFRLNEAVQALPKGVTESRNALELVKTSDSIILSTLRKLSREGIHPLVFFEEAAKALGLATKEDAFPYFLGDLNSLCELSGILQHLKEDYYGTEFPKYISGFASRGELLCQTLIKCYEQESTAYPGYWYVKTIDFIQLLEGCSNDPAIAQHHHSIKTIEVIDTNFNRVRQMLRELPRGNAMDPESLIRAYDSLLNLPVKPALYRFLPMVNEVSKRLGKKVQFRVKGEDITMNRDHLHLLTDALTHMVRNSIDHGMEGPEGRIAAKKPEYGTVEIECVLEDSAVGIHVRDDGRGINVQKVVEKAVKQGLVSEDQVQKMTAQQKLELIFLPGLSTKQDVTELSGRGVGMDIVKTNVEKIGGNVQLSSQEGSGTEFVIRLLT